MTKSAIISPVLPPSSSGQAIVLYQLLKNHDPSKFIFISNKDYLNPHHSQSFTAKLPNKYYYFDPAFKAKKYSSLEKKIILYLSKNGFNKPLNLVLNNRANKIAKIIKNEGCNSVISCTADLFGPPISYLAGRLTNIPFILYAFDHYSTQWTIPFERKFAEKWEKIICNNAIGIIVPNEFLKNTYHQLYNINPAVIHNPCDLSYYTFNSDFFPIKRNSNKIRLTYTGSVYTAHYDAFKSLSTAMNKISNFQLELHIYTNQNPQVLKNYGIDGDIKYHEYIKTKLIPKIQQEADILVLPLAFDSPYPEIIRTSSPGKMGEYLASGRPILVYAPRDSYLSCYFKKYECGLVINKNDPVLLAKGIEILINDTTFQKKLIRNARKRAIEDFDLQKIKDRFFKTIDSFASQ